MTRRIRLALILAVSLLLPFWALQLTMRAANLDRGPAADQAVGSHADPGYRSPGDRHKVQITDRTLVGDLKARGGRLIADYGGYVLMELSTRMALDLAARPDVEPRDEYNLVRLNAGHIDTTRLEARSPRGGAGGLRGKRLHLVQFAGPVKPEWYDGLTRTGVKVVTYIPSNTYLVYGNQASLRRLETMIGSADYVQWNEEYKDEYKMDPGLRTLDEKGNPVPPAGGLYAIQLVEDKEENPVTLQLIEQLALEPIVSQFRVLDYLNVIVQLSSESVEGELAKRPDVISIAPYIVPTKMDERQDQIVAGNLTGSSPTPGDYLAYLASRGFTQGQFTASGFAVNVSDSGIDNATTTPNHFGLYLDGIIPGTSRIIYNRLEGTPHAGGTLQGCDGHGNLNAHIVGGFVPGSLTGFPHRDASGFRYGLGVCPFVKMGSSVIFDPNSFTFPNLINLESKAYNDGARLSTNSWGANTAGGYNIDSQTFDAIVRDAQPAGSTFPAPGNQEYVVIFAAGNAGPGSQTVGAPGTAKNVITAGASENVHSHSTANGGNNAGGNDGCNVPDSGADSANDIIGFSSRGPASDGRKKPELVAPGTHVTGGVFQVPSPGPNGTAAACFTGLGVCALPGSGTPGDPDNFFPAGQQFYSTSSGTSHSTPAIAGAAALVRQRFINQGLTIPSPAMTKAALMNTARYLTGAGANDTLWSNNQGMGEVHLESFFDVFVTPTILHDQLGFETFSASGQTRIITGTVSDGSKPFRVTLAWTDAPGPTSGNAYVNNLDLEVTVGGNTYKGNVFSGPSSATGGTADIRNNAESVFIPAGVTGSFIATVRATNIAGDGVPNSGGSLDQDFALVIYNAVAAALPVMAPDGATVAAESCSPANGAVDPNETVTLSLAVRNFGTANTANLVGTLLATGGVGSPSGPQTYGVVVAGGPAVARSFSFTVNKNCGETLTASLQLQDGPTDLGTVTFRLATGTLGPAVVSNYSSGGIAVTIPDLSTIEVPITVVDTGVVSDVNVRIRLDHTFDADLDIFLVSPDGTTVELSTDNGSSGNNFGSGTNDCSGTPTVFDDSAAASITSGTVPFAGTFRPEQPLSALNGKSINGTWKLRITDDLGGDTGTVGCWELEINRQQFICCGVAGTPNVISGGAATVSTESCNPASGAPDPGETVTVNLPLRNVGTGDTSNLVATLLATGGVQSPSGAQSYGVVVAGGPAVSRAFTFTVDKSCGEVLTATLSLQDGPDSLGTVSFNLQTGTLSPPISLGYSSGGVSVALPDLTTVEVPLNVPDVGVVGDVDVRIRLNHTFDGDLAISLVHPDGTAVFLSNRRGGSGDNFGSGANDCSGTPTVFDDSAITAIGSGTAPFAGTFKPDQALSTLNGKPSSGTWKLRITDAAAGDVGTLFCFQLQIGRQVFLCCGVPGNPSILAAPPAVITGESCGPANGAVDPDETVTVNFPLRNVGTGHTSNLVATLLPGGGVNQPGGPQSYGVLTVGGPPVERPFSFVPSGTCGGSVTATLHLQDGTTDLGNVSFNLVLGTIASTPSSFANPASIGIPSSGVAAPYPSNIVVSGFAGTVSKVTVALTNLNHTFPDDVDVLLVGPTGAKMILMSDAGGGLDVLNVTLNFDDTAPGALPDSTQIVSGTFRPTNFLTGDTFPAPAPPGPYGSALSVFNGLNPNGTWSLYVFDDASGDLGNISGGWNLTLIASAPVCCDQPCSLTCPANVSVPNDPGACGAVVGYPSASVSGTCGTLASSPSSGSTFPVGTTPVTSTATRSGGATTTCSFTVTVNDVEAPVPTCPADVSVPNDPNACSAVVNTPAPAVTDNCPGATVGAIPPSGSTFPVGTTPVSVTASDAHGNTAGCGFSVTVNDTQPPAVTCPANISRNTDPGSCTAVVNYPPIAGSDNCPGFVITGTPPSGFAFPVGSNTVTGRNTDASGNIATCQFTVAINQIATLSGVTVTPATRQYSDPVTFAASLAPGSCSSQAAASSVTFFVGSQNVGTVPLVEVAGVLQGSLVAPLIEPSPYGTAPTGQMAPGAHTVTAQFNGVNPTFIVSNPTTPLTITQEDARANYTGALFVSTSGISSGSAVITLAATVQDITATPDAAGDADFGDIRNATVTFINRDTNTPIATVPVGLVSPGDTKTGTATYNWTVNIGAANSQSFTVGMTANNYYTRNSALDDTIVTVSKPLEGSFITGGGYLALTDSSGAFAGDPDSHNNFGFSVKYNKGGTNLQGGINTIVRHAGRVYQIKGTVMTSLYASPLMGRATFNGKANIKDVSDPQNPISVDGNATLQVSMFDGEQSGGPDRIGITVWNKNGGLWFSSLWTGTATAQQALGGGNLVVH